MRWSKETLRLRKTRWSACSVSWRRPTLPTPARMDVRQLLFSQKKSLQECSCGRKVTGNSASQKLRRARRLADFPHRLHTAESDAHAHGKSSVPRPLRSLFRYYIRPGKTAHQSALLPPGQERRPHVPRHRLNQTILPHAGAE